MQAQKSDTIPDLCIIVPAVFADSRGEFVETYNERDYAFTDLDGMIVKFVQDNVSFSRHHVLRGLHGDTKTWKLIQCMHGEIMAVVVDMRKKSPGYLKHETLPIDDRNRKQILIPPGCASGYLCVSDSCLVSYKQSEYYSGPEAQFTVRWDDPAIGISWPIATPLLSARDSSAKYIQQQ